MISLTPFRRSLLTAPYKRPIGSTFSRAAAKTTPSAKFFNSLHRPLVSPTPPAYLYQRTLNSRHFHQTTPKMVVSVLSNKQEFDEALKQTGSLMVLDCHAVWCGPCKVISPKVEEFSKKYSDARFYKLDVDEVPQVASELGIQAMPTFLFFKDGERISEVVGANPKAVEAAITSNL